MMEVVEAEVSGSATTALAEAVMDTGSVADSRVDGTSTHDDEDEDEWLGGMMMEDVCARGGGGKGGGSASPRTRGGGGGGVGLGLSGSFLSLHRLVSSMLTVSST